MSLPSARLFLKYGATTLPTIADRRFETWSGNWTGNGNHSVAQSGAQYYGGAYSLKISSGGNGDFSTNYADLPSGDNATFVVGAQYAVGFWAYCAAGGYGFAMKTGGVADATFITPNAIWEPFNLVFTALTATTALQIYNGFVGDLYIDDIVISKCVYFDVMSEKGLTDPDDFEWFPAIQKTLLDGSIVEQWKTYRRWPTFDCGVVASHADRVGASIGWGGDTARTIDYQTEMNLTMALKDPKNFRFQWLNNVSVARQLTLELMEPFVRDPSSFPV